MKQQDVAILIIIVFVTVVASFFMANKFITPSSQKLSSKKVTPITADFQLPDDKYFNEQSINPTVRIQIAPNTNDQPFADPEQ